MKKEQIAFGIVVVLLAAFWFLGGKDEEPTVRRRPGGGGDNSAVKGEEHKGFWIGDDDSGWSASAARNPYQAPRETRDLDPLDLAAPPFPRLPHHGLPLVPVLTGAPLAALRHELASDAKIALPAPGTRAPEAAPTGSNGGGDKAPAKSDLADVDTSNVGMTIADKIQLKAEDKVRREKRIEDARRQEAERKKLLDQVTWMSGETSFGNVVELDKKDSRYVVKDAIDRIRSDVSIADDERKKRLDALKFVLRDDRGPGKSPGRTVVTATSVQRIEFSPAVPLHKFHMSKLSTPKDDLARQEDLAKLVYETGEYAVASAHLEEMLSRGLSSPKVFGMLADCYRKTFRYDQELRALDRGLASMPDDVGLNSRVGMLSLRLGLRERAERAFSKVLAADPGNSLAHLGLGQFHVERGEGDPAVAHLRQAETGTGLDKEQQVRTLGLLGEAWLLKGNLQSAGTYFNQVLDRDPKNAAGFAGSAVATFASGGAAAAKAIVDRGREQAPLNGTLAYLDGVCLLRLGKWVEARDTLLVSMEFDPFVTPFARTALSYLLEKTGQDEAALGEADLALQADPLNVEARLQRARVLLNIGDLSGAKDEYLRVLESMPDRVDILMALGDAAFRSGSHVEAARFYARAEAKEPGFPDLLARRIICEVRRRRAASAEELMKRIDAKMEQNPFIQAAEAYAYYERKSDETVRRFRLIAEKKSGPPELQVYAAATMAAIEDNLAKEKWVDSFNRSGGQLLRGWKKETPAGINVAVNDGQARFEGTQKTRSDDATVLFQERPGRVFFSYAADLDMKPAPGAFAGIGIMTFNQSPKEPDPWPGLQKREGRAFSHLGLQVALAPQGKLQWRKIVQGKPTEWEDVPANDYAGGSVTVGIELADSQKSIYRVLVDSHVVLPAIDIPGLSRRAGILELQVFSQAQIDRPVSFTADNITIVTFKK